MVPNCLVNKVIRRASGAPRLSEFQSFRTRFPLEFEWDPGTVESACKPLTTHPLAEILASASVREAAWILPVLSLPSSSRAWY